MNTINTGRFIYELRKEKGLTQKELAEKLNVTDKAVSKWETGKCAPDISLLVSLSEILGVSVIEILQGEKIKEECFPQVSDEVIVKTIKKSTKKQKHLILIVAAFMFIFLLLISLAYPTYHFFNSAPADNENAIIKQAEHYVRFWDEESEKPKIVKQVKKGDFFFFLIKGKENTAMIIFQKNKLYDNRISFFGGGSCSEPNKIVTFCSNDNNATINVFYGYDMTDRTYSYYYRGVKSTKAIEDKLLLDVFIDIDDTWTYAKLIYDE